MRWSKAKAILAAGILLAGVQPSGSLSSAGQGVAAQSPSATPPAAATPTQTPAQEPTPADVAPAPQSPGTSTAQARSAPVFFVMIDPAHGGDDHGTVLPGNLVEKDVTLALARRLKSELQERGIPARLLRDADVSLSLEQRAQNTNEQHAAAYVALHAGMPGQGVRIYAPAFSFAGPSGGKFLLWESAQANSLPRSQELAQRITVELGKKSVETMELAGPLRPLNNVSAPAVAVELAPNPRNIQDIMGQKFQTAVAAAIATGIAQLRSQLEGEQ